MTALAERNSWAAEGVDDLLKFSRKASQEEPQLVRTLRGHRGAVHGVAFSPTRRQLASTGGDGAVMLWSFGMRDEATRRWVEERLRGVLLTEEEMAQGSEAWVEQMSDPYAEAWEQTLLRRQQEESVLRHTQGIDLLEGLALRAEVCMPCAPRGKALLGGVC